MRLDFYHKFVQQNFVLFIEFKATNFTIKIETMKINFAIYPIVFAILLLPILFSCKKEVIKVVPTTSVALVTNITATTASCGGEVTSDGGALVTARGVCWSISQNPTTANDKTTDGTGIGIFTRSITGLTPGTTYNIVAYAINSVGTGYSSQSTFTTLALAPILTTTELSAVTSTSASSGGNINNDGGSTITARGVCWSTDQNPTIADNKTTNGTGTGSFTSYITGLIPGKTYYIRAYAANIIGTAYGNQITTITTAILPTITTNAVSDITSTTARSGGNITNDGGAEVTVRGVCWSTFPNPTTASNKTNEGIGSGSFTILITGLIQGTTYYLKAYATNNIGTTYGNQVTTTTTIVLPVLTTITMSDITPTTAISGGNISNEGISPVTVRGVCWNTTENPTIGDNKTVNGSGVGNFTSSLTGLAANTTYYVRAYATNSMGTAYGKQTSFISGILVIGQPYQGGVIAYILQPDEPGYIEGQTHGLIASLRDQSTSMPWFSSNTKTGAIGIMLGTGKENTNTIVNSHGSGFYAAELCYDLVSSGYSDWYLPSKNELDKLYLNKNAIGGFSNSNYWSSSEYDTYYYGAWGQSFLDGTQSPFWLNSLYSVRPVRSF